MAVLAPGAEPTEPLGAGAEPTEPLARLLLERAVAWAEAVAGPRTLVATVCFPAGVEALAEELAVSPEDPFLLVWPRLGRPTEHLARAALEDLHTGCAMTLGPVFDGGLYLLGVRERLDLLAEVPSDAWSSGEVVGAAVAAAARHGVDVGLLRTERGLARPADVRAALADPLLDGELRAVLEA